MIPSIWIKCAQNKKERALEHSREHATIGFVRGVYFYFRFSECTTVHFDRRLHFSFAVRLTKHGTNDAHLAHLTLFLSVARASRALSSHSLLSCVCVCYISDSNCKWHEALAFAAARWRDVTRVIISCALRWFQIEEEEKKHKIRRGKQYFLFLFSSLFHRVESSRTMVEFVIFVLNER